MRRFVARLVLAGTFVFLVAMSPPAQAIDLNPFNNGCTVNLVVDNPKSGVENQIDPGPTNPAKGDPWVKNPKSSIYANYGYGGLEWPNFTCTIAGKLTPGTTNLGLWVDNFIFQTLQLSMSVSARIIALAYNPAIFAPLTPVLHIATSVLGNFLFKTFFWMTLAITGIGVVLKSRKASVREAATNFGWIASIMLIATACIAYPLIVVPKVDATIASGVSIVNTSMSDAAGGTGTTASESINANLHYAILYQTWCSGMVGRSGGATADEYCPKLFKAGTLSRAEMDKVDASKDRAGALNDIVQKNGDEYQKIADDLKKDDPTAYSYLTGDHNNARIGYALFAWFGWICSGPFVLIAGFLVLFALIILRLAIIVFPAVAIFGGHPKYRHVVTSMFDYVAGAFVNAAVFGVLSAVFVIAIGVLMGPGSASNFFTSIILLLVMTVAAFKISKPFRRIRDMSQVVPGRKKRIAHAAWEAAMLGGTLADAWGSNHDNQGKPGPTAQPGPGPQYGDSSTYHYADVIPAEAQPSPFRAAVTGAKQGAVAAAAVGVATGGAATAAGIAAGAAKGAGSSVVPFVAASGGAATPPPRTMPKGVKGNPAEATPSRVFMPGEKTPGGPLVAYEPQMDNGERVYKPYVPSADKGVNTDAGRGA